VAYGSLIESPALYYDLGSPYAYLAVARAERALGAAPQLRPVLLGAIFAARGHGSWAHTPTRAENVAEVERRAAAYGLPPVRWPPDWPPNTLAAMRAAVWAGRAGRGDAFAHAAFRRAFADGDDLADARVLTEIAAEAGLPGDELEAAIAAPDVKAELRERTDAALERGVRGVPTLELDGRLLYGDDAMGKGPRASGRP
jgi:2-hydroxychromene-2-carboxylate isomerase